MKNKDIRQAAKDAGLHLWQIADCLGIRDNEFSRSLRYELADFEKTKIKTIIVRLAKERKRANA